MSSYSDNIPPPSSSQFVPPQSAQPYRSIFGGPSSDAGPLPSSQPEPPRRSIFGGPSSNHVIPKLNPMSEGPEYEDLEALLRNRPLEADYNSDGESFQGSLDGEDVLGLESEPELPQKKQTRLASHSPSQNAPPMTYYLDRGLDLPSGTPRPNRWDGNHSTYRRLISDEKGAYEAILANRSMDLAGHLYDSFVLRNQKVGESLGLDDESEDPAAFKKVWAGWPMQADKVPRSDEYIRRQLDDPDTYRMVPDLRPSADLEESIIASMLKSAKETFMAREWDDEEIRIPRARTQEDEDEDKMDIEDESKQYESESGASGRGSVDPEPLRPVFQADDDKSRRQLRPLSRNVITQLDRILLGLNSAMQGRTRTRTGVQKSGADTEFDTEDEESRPPSRGRRSKSGQASDAEEPYDSHESSDEDVGPHGTKRKADQDLFFQRGGQRDWSEVIGIASMSGLPADTVMRASKRCSDLFGQDMTFRRFHEGRMHKTESGNGNLHQEYIESCSEGEDITSRVSKKPRKKKERDDGPPVAPKPKGKGAHRKADIICPFTSCPRHTLGFSRTWNLTLHMRKAHGRERGTEISKEKDKSGKSVIEID